MGLITGIGCSACDTIVRKKNEAFFHYDANNAQYKYDHVFCSEKCARTFQRCQCYMQQNDCQRIVIQKRTIFYITNRKSIGIVILAVNLTHKLRSAL